jgi:excisionase family DNA binding protein
MDERHLSLSEAADALNISVRTAYRWIKSGKLRAYKPGRDYWIPESAIREVVKESKVRPKAPSRSSLEPSLLNGLEDEWLEATPGAPIVKESAATAPVRTTGAARPAVLYILRRVARGEISPEEGAQQLEAIGA